MRIIVHAYRVLIILAALGCLALALIPIALFMLPGGVTGGVYADWSWLGVAALVAFVIMSGMTATIISLHDRHVEIVGELRGIREALEHLAWKE